MWSFLVAVVVGDLYVVGWMCVVYVSVRGRSSSAHPPTQLPLMFHMRVYVLLRHASNCVLFRTVGAAAASIMNDAIKD